ncbi:MAG: WYL domain-containing protein [Firmicutes bacterium]|nr:WYL domain-containing protein [Bacillota bacterium]
MSMTFPYFHHVLDDHLVWTLLRAMGKERIVTFWYGRDQSALKHFTVEPVRVLLDLTYSRWYLVGKQAGDSYLRSYRLDRMMGLEVGEERFEMEALEEQYFREYETSWLSVGSREKPPVKVELRFRQKGESDYPFVLNRVRRQARGGVITEITDKEFLYTVNVNDPVELLPWIRSFNHHVEVLPSAEHDLRERLDSERRRMLANYGVVCQE